MSLKNKINFLPLVDINNSYRKEILNAFTNVLDSGIYLNGHYNSVLNSKLSNLIGVKYTINTSNGFDSLKIIFKSLIELKLLKVGDEVLVPSFTFIASITSIIHSGLVPVLVDADYESFNIDILDFKRKISSKTKAALFVHLFGRSCWNKDLQNIIDINNLLTVEDCAQSIGANYDNKKLGSIGFASAFSFYPGKNLGALGDAGAICTNNQELYNVAIKYSNYGSSIKYNHDLLGENCRMDELQAAVLSIKINNVNEILKTRQKIAEKYLKQINNSKIILPKKSILGTNAWHLFVLKTENRDSLIKYLTKNNIETIIHYPIPFHHQKFSKIQLSLPITERISKECLSIPNHENLTENEIDYIIEILNSF
jgi:dTDP-4-amino-4,6-dideoxygalactose transaminase